MKRVAIVCMLVAVLCGRSWGAMLVEGTREVSASGSLEQDDSTILTLAFTGGYFIRRALEVGGSLELETAGRAYTQTHVGGLLEWNWDTHLPVVPYVGTYVGLVYATVQDAGSDMAGEWSGWGGAKCYLLENLAFGAQIQIWMATNDIYLTGTHEYGSSEWGFVLRTCFYF
jgi:hypothetical protein